jgi:hypothetical protein
MRAATERGRACDYLLQQNPILNEWFEGGGYLSLEFSLPLSQNCRGSIRVP